MSHVTCMNESCHTNEYTGVTAAAKQHTYVIAAREYVMSHVSMSHVTHMNESCHTYQ